MFSLPEKQLLTDILNDYLKFDQRIVKDDELVLNLIQKFAVEKKISGLLTQQQVADEMGIDKRTLMNRINNHKKLVEELQSAGWRPYYQRGFVPKEVEIIRRWML
jgi:hypothetical protein